MAKTKVVVQTDLRAKDSTSKKLIRMAHTARKAAAAVRGISRALGKISARAVKVSVVGGAALTTLATLANQRTREMENLAKSVGQNVVTMEALGVVAGKIGLNYENVVDLAEEMNNKLGEFAGLGEMNSAKESLEIIGLQFEDIKKLKPEKQFERITEALLAMPDQQKASSAADMLFGGEASKFFGLMHRMGMSLKDIKKQYKENNFLTDRGRKGAVRWAQSMGRLGVQAKTLGAQVAGVLGGALAPFVEKITAWATANKGLIESKINEWGERLSVWVNEVDFTAIGTSAENFAKTISEIDWSKTVTSVQSVVSVFGSVASGVAVAYGAVSNFFRKFKAAGDAFNASATGRAMTEMMDFMGMDVSHVREANEKYANRHGVQGFSDDERAGRTGATGDTRPRRYNGRDSTFFDLADDAKAHRGTGRTSYADDGSMRHLQNFVGAAVSEIRDQAAKVEASIASLHGALDIKISGSIAGATINNVGTVKRTALVGNVGTNMPSGVR